MKYIHGREQFIALLIVAVCTAIVVALFLGLISLSGRTDYAALAREVATCQQTGLFTRDECINLVAGER